MPEEPETIEEREIHEKNSSFARRSAGLADSLSFKQMGQVSQGLSGSFTRAKMEAEDFLERGRRGLESALDNLPFRR